MPFTLPQLPYSYDALEPAVDARTMEIHHSKHHAGYVAKLNAALEGNKQLETMPIEDILEQLDDVVPAEIVTAVRNNGGGHANHSLFWQILTPGGNQEIDSKFRSAIDQKFRSLDTFKSKFLEATAGQFGSGWGWLVISADETLEIVTTPNQDSPLLSGHKPILGIDVWEHAYYLKYQNHRADYLEKIWEVINWQQVSKNYLTAVDQSQV